MGMLDSLLQQVGGPDKVSELAAKVGLSENQVAMGMKALGQSHSEPGDTAEVAAQKSGIPHNKMQDMLNQIGGEGMLGKISGFLDQDGDGNPLNDITGMAGKFFGKK